MSCAGRRIARTNALAACLAGMLALMQLGFAGALQSPSGIDPCSRAIARRATPVATETPEPSANRVAVSQAVMYFTSCFNRRVWDGVLALTNDGFRASMFGVRDAEQLRAQLDAMDSRDLLPQIRIQSIEENGTTGSALATLVVTWQEWSGVRQELWRLQIENGHWMLSGRSIQSPQMNGPAVGIRFKLDVGELSSPAMKIANPGTVIFAFQNRTDEEARVLVLRVGNTATTEGVIAACNGTGPIGYQPAAALQIPPGQIVSIPMLDLMDGAYAVIAGDNPCAGEHQTTASQVELLRIKTVSEV